MNRKIFLDDWWKITCRAEYQITVTNVAHVYREVIKLKQRNMLWHMDDDPKDCFSDCTKQVQEDLCELQDRLWDVCRYERVDIHGICVDVLQNEEL